MSEMCITTFNQLNTSLNISLFLTGLVGGFTHCSAMCGPFIIAQTTSHDEQQFSLKKLRSFALFPYHFGRATTYLALAALFSSLIHLPVFSAGFKTVVSSLLLTTAACMFLASVLPVFSTFFPWLARINLSVLFPVVKKFLTPLSTGSSMGRSYLLGLMLGFLPCSMVTAAIFAASSANTHTQTLLAMGSFVLGTLPALWLTAAGVHVTQRIWPTLIPRIKTSFTVISGLSLLYIAGTLVL